MIQTLEWTDSGVRFIDQTKLPLEETYVTCKTHVQVADAIRNMVVRGAPAIGVAAAMGTALGVIRAAVEQGKKIHVFADETRPFLQGSRLTAWELMKDGIPTTVIPDNMAGAMMKQGKIKAIVVGADRIAANGDVANKIGTYMLAVLAKAHGIPFYVAAPFSTVALDTPDGSRIPIEQRNPREVTHIAGKQMVPDGTEVENPAFDVTPAKYVSAIVTEKGIAHEPYGESLRKLSDDVAVLQH